MLLFNYLYTISFDFPVPECALRILPEAGWYLNAPGFAASLPGLRRHLTGSVFGTGMPGKRALLLLDKWPSLTIMNPVHLH
jgi:hypothetical protein